MRILSFPKRAGVKKSPAVSFVEVRLQEWKYLHERKVNN